PAQLARAQGLLARGRQGPGGEPAREDERGRDRVNELAREGPRATSASKPPDGSSNPIYGMRALYGPRSLRRNGRQAMPGKRLTRAFVLKGRSYREDDPAQGLTVGEVADRVARL